MQLLRPATTAAELADILASVRQHALGFRGVAVANEWGAAYFAEHGILPSAALRGAIDADSNELRSLGSLEALARARMLAAAPERISPQRIHAATRDIVHLLDSGWPPPSSRFLAPVDWQRFRDDIALAVAFSSQGVEVPTDPRFRPSASRGRCPLQYREALTAVNAHIHANRTLGFAVLVDPILLEDQGIHLQNFGFAVQHGKDKGRLVSNLSGVAAPGFSYRKARRINPAAGTILPLNTKVVRDIALTRWGLISHPTLCDVARMVLRGAEEFGWDDLVLFKEDVRGFYQLVWFHPAFVRLMCFQVFTSPDAASPAAICVSLAGNFGWTAMPMVMEVITRLLRVLISLAMVGWMLMYVDDIIAVSPRHSWHQDRQTAIDTLQQLLGPRAHAEDKGDSTEGKPRREIDALGWSIDLDRRQVTVARKNQLRALHWFMVVDLDQRLDFQTKERLCSLAERYSHVFSELRLLMPALYSMLGGRHRVDPGVLLPTPPRAVWAIRMWRVYLLAAEADFRAGVDAGRPLHWYAEREVTGIVEFDGCLDGTGWRLLRQGVCVASAFVSTPGGHLPSRDSSYQNVMELTALTLALLHAVSLGWQDCGVRLRGDSDTVLHWSTSERFRSDHATHPASLFMSICRQYRLHIHSQSEWIPGTENAICDHLSRSRPTDALASGDCGPSGPLDLSQDERFALAMRFCRPKSLTDLSESDFFAAWAQASTVCSTFAPHH